MEISKIIILGTNYKVEYVDCISREELRLGEIDYLDQKILLLNGLGLDAHMVTMFHEILHGILNQLGFEQSADEHLIQSLATSIYQVFKDNPAIAERQLRLRRKGKIFN